MRRLARETYQRFEQDPWHPSLRFKQIRNDIWSARVGLGYRALGLREGDEITWFRIGSHAEYDRMIKAV
jgi:hypothetical protein